MVNLFYHWNFNIINACALLLLCMLYAYAVYFHFGKKSLYFFSAIAVIILCIASPLHFLGSHFLFSAHMLAHVLLLLIAGPLLVASIPPGNRFEKLFLFISKNVYAAPLVTWGAGVCVMWIWHIPPIFNKVVSLNSMKHLTPWMDVLMSAHMMSLVVAGIFFSWPVINPYKQYRLGALRAVAYLASACVFCSLLGLLITFAPAGTYTHYIATNDSYSFLKIIRNNWNLSAEEDQQIAGLVMWVPCCFIYLSASMAILIKWFQEKDILKTIEENISTH